MRTNQNCQPSDVIKYQSIFITDLCCKFRWERRKGCNAMAGSISTVCIVIITACCTVVTIVTLIIAVHYCTKNVSKCGKYKNYEKPLKKQPKENLTMAYSAMQPAQHIPHQQQYQYQQQQQQQRPMSTVPSTARHPQAEMLYSDI
ncbi:hypothetical protein FSP39_003213 [Pinctada imbricata]|uniref:Uncharacterized protein n=1 Tax=Pinctada imbricata TaxID=66713 RepID=A0AA89C9N3_PINIB|nr:hypothetical protein FSP39_003213 [Pinctada imbricata]